MSGLVLSDEDFARLRLLLAKVAARSPSAAAIGNMRIIVSCQWLRVISHGSR